MITTPGKFLILVLILGLCSVAVGPAAAQNLSKRNIKAAQKALKAADKNQWKTSARLTKSISHPVLVKIIKWRRLASSASSASFSQIESFLKSSPDWPRRSLLIKHAEIKMPVDMAAEKIIAWFNNRDPLTADGGFKLANALLKTGALDAAQAVIRKTWIDKNFGAKQEREFYRKYRKYLTREDHVERLERLLWLGRYSPVRRMYRRVNPNYRALAEARITLRLFRGGVDRAIARVPTLLKDHPGLIYERLRWRRRKGRDVEARELLRGLPDDVLEPDRWWRERSILARRALKDGHISIAYKISKDHGLSDGIGFLEAEWLAGWIALRFLHDNKNAYDHFTALHRIARFPISKARGAYWAGRAAKALNDQKRARSWFEKAGRYPMTFYGQLGTDELPGNGKLILPASPHIDPIIALGFDNHELVKVVRIMIKAKLTDYLRPFIIMLNEIGATPGWRSKLAELAGEAGRPDLAIYTAKKAHQVGISLVAAGFPLLSNKIRKGLESSLLFAIIRQESAFYVKAKSHAGARGLMQLMPQTARRVAKRQSVPYRRSKLIDDPNYNLRIGQAYLDELLRDFNGSYLLSLAAYNAGPGRVRRWIKKNGDPRDSSVDPIDWVELIPFRETRNYVQRVLENLHVYRNRSAVATASFNPLGDLKR